VANESSLSDAERENMPFQGVKNGIRILLGQEPSVNQIELKSRIKHSLRLQGFVVTSKGVSPPGDLDKDGLRQLHSLATEYCREKARPALQRLEPELLQSIANGTDINPESIEPVLVAVERRSFGELLFRYASLHWSIPVSSGYGRRLRFLCVDRSNGKLIGIIGLCDPVIALSPRDTWIGWTEGQRLDRLRHVMDAFVLGAVPPYSSLLFGKFLALVASSDEVRQAFKKKYAGTTSRIGGRSFDGRLALITTMSALGRSSVYNRLTFSNRRVFESLGFSRGTGEFQFSNGLYQTIASYANRYCEATYRQEAWGSGFRNRREVIRKCLRKMNLSMAWSHHGVQREVFGVPLARNSREFLRGENSRLQWYSAPMAELYGWFRQRWLLSRSERDGSYREFDKGRYRLWQP
jgi:hypothetical protein